MTGFRTLALGLAGALLLAAPAIAAEFEVKMLNKGSDNQLMVFEPAFLKIAPGDVVHFVPTDKSHDVQAIPGMAPEGTPLFKGKMSQELTVTFDKPGVYGYRCLPHFGMGMVGLIEVGGDASNLDAARKVKLPPLAAKRMAVLFDQAKSSATAAAAGATHN